ncbi:MAG TPA: hypothetical protein VI338_03095, partial [Nitrososphaera sp.]|nr:hypothetical protein [Nitrososphaera sp.]
MTIREIPLFDLFDRLRQHGLPLGVDDYMILLRALQAGFGVEDHDSLRRLCCTLWTKSESDVHLFDWMYQQLLFQPTNTLPEIQLPEEEETIPQSVRNEQSEQPIEIRSSIRIPVISDLNGYELSQVVQAVRSNGLGEDVAL